MTPSILTQLQGIPTGNVMEQLPDHIEDFISFLIPLKDKRTFRDAAFSHGFELKGFKTFVANIVALEEDLRSEVAENCEQILRELQYGIFDADTNTFLDVSDLLEGIIGSPAKMYLKNHQYPPEKK